MISLPPTLLLTLSLLAATVLGGGIGACLWHLRSAKRLEQVRQAARRRFVSERGALDTILARERESAMLKRAEAHESVAHAREETARLQARHDRLVEHAREQGRRMAALEARILVHEKRREKPGRVPAGGREERHPAGRPPANTRLGPGIAEREAGRIDDDDLPILNRRVGSRPVPGKRRSVGGKLDLPTLAESELPREADKLALELLDTRDLFPDRDD